MQRAEVHVVAGLAGFLPFISYGTRALDKLFDEISPIWDATHWLHSSWEKVAEGIIARARRYKDKPKVILVGHSYGAWRIIQIALRLQSYNIRVDLLVGIDPTCLPKREKGQRVHPMVLPKNVDRCIEIWATVSGPPKSCRRRAPDGSKGGMYVIPQELEHRHELTKVAAAHIPVAAHTGVVSKIVMEVEKVLK